MKIFLQMFLNYFVPCFTVVLSYLLGRRENLQSNSRKILEQRYESFYVPFVSMLYRGLIWEIRFTELSAEARSSFLDILMQNLHLVDENTQMIIPDFYQKFLDFMEWDSGNTEFENASDNLDKIFLILVKRILSESSRISHKLKLPDISISVLNSFSQSSCWKGLTTEISS